jgi:hypothetical protein
MFARRNLSRSGGLTLSGIEQVVQSSSDFWEASLTLKLRRYEQVKAYRAIQALNFGRSGEWLIPALGGFEFELSFGDDFGDDFTSGTPAISAHVTSAMGIGGRVLHFTMDNPIYVPHAGDYFGIGDRLYLIGAISGSGGTYTVDHAPGLRIDALVGTMMNFSSPCCRMRLAQDNIGQMNLDLLRFADVSLSFVEIPS